MDRIELIGTDLDGTLLNDDKELSPATLEALNTAYENGIRIVPITGRPLHGVPKCVRELKEIEYIIPANGASIYDVKSGKELFSFAINSEKSRQLIDRLRKLDCMFEPFADGVGYTEQNVFDFYIATFSGTPLEDYFFSSRKIVSRYEEIFDGERKRADEVFVNCADARIRDSVIEICNEIGGLQYCSLGDRFIEITRLGTDKGSALRKICEHLKIDVQNTLAFGDGENDLSFIKAAGFAVAMENAYPIIKENADLITDSNNNDGVAKIINNMIKK